jgi:membrane protein YdbS with pleckstrin-like domain
VLTKPILIVLVWAVATVAVWVATRHGAREVGWIVAALGVFPLAYLFWRVLARRCDLWAVTSQRVVDEWGVLSHHAKESPLDKVNNISYEQTLVGRMMGYGSVQIQTAAEMGATTYDLVNNLDYMNASPQVMRALLRQLVNVVGANQADISIGDPTCLFPNQFHDPLKAEFPNVRYLDHNGGNASHPRTLVTLSSVPFYWSARPTGVSTDYVPSAYAQAVYFINLANFKAHGSAGVTFCGKNHYGSLKRYPAQNGYYSMHKTLADLLRESGQYRCMVDLMGHAHTGRKTLVYLFDGLYSGIHPTESSPHKWNSAPFNGDWTSSLFASQDPVAIDSVGYDFMWNEWLQPRLAGTEDYLHEAAQADNPPSGTFYDPDHATRTTRLPSLGTHEHWNNPTDRKYSRNLGTGNGIELLQAGLPIASIQASPTGGCPPLPVQFDASGSVDVDGSIVSYAWDFDGDGTVDDTGGPLASHVYSGPGRFIARLEVRDNEGFAGTAAVQVNVTEPDFNSDRDVDQEDYAFLQLCLGGGLEGPLESDCQRADLNGNGRVDSQDVVIFCQSMTRPGGTAARSRIILVSPSFLRMAAPRASPKQLACEAAPGAAHTHSIALVPLFRPGCRARDATGTG